MDDAHAIPPRIVSANTDRMIFVNMAISSALLLLATIDAVLGLDKANQD